VKKVEGRHTYRLLFPSTSETEKEKVNSKEEGIGVAGGKKSQKMFEYVISTQNNPLPRGIIHESRTKHVRKLYAKGGIRNREGWTNKKPEEDNHSVE